MSELKKLCDELIDFNIECEICEILEEEWHEELFDYLENYINFSMEKENFTIIFT